MQTIPGYEKVNYSQFIKGLKAAFDKEGKPEAKLMEATKKSSSHIQNLFKTKEQKATDKLLTEAAKIINFECLVLWNAGKKYYFIASKAS